MHAEALTRDAAALFPKLSRFESFYLVGGTALALQIGHRISVDFDLFSEKNFLQPNLLQRVRRAYPDALIKITYRAPGQLNILLDAVRATFFYFPYPVLEPLREYQDVPMATVAEIAAMKAFSIGKRLSYKDYIDWYFLLSEKHVRLGEVVAMADKKFAGEFNTRLFLGQLVSITDVPTLEIDFLRDPVDRETVQKFLEQTVRDFIA